MVYDIHVDSRYLVVPFDGMNDDGVEIFTHNFGDL